MSYKIEIDKILCDGVNPLKVCKEVIRISDKYSDKKEEIYTYFLMTKRADKDYNLDSDEENELRNIAVKYNAVFGGLISYILAQFLPEDIFYKNIYSLILECSFARDSNDKAYALMYVWTDDCLPYTQLEKGLTMENEKYIQTCNKLEHLINKARLINRTPFTQKTQRASLFLDLLNSNLLYDEKVVLMSQIMSFARK